MVVNRHLLGNKIYLTGQDSRLLRVQLLLPRNILPKLSRSLSQYFFIVLGFHSDNVFYLDTMLVAFRIRVHLNGSARLLVLPVYIWRSQLRRRV